MVQLNWLDSYNLGIAGIDDQHHLLVGLINDLAGAMKEGKSREVLSEILTGLAAYTVYHFAIEEKLFNQYGYPEAATHEKEHRGFIKKVNEYKREFGAGSFTVSMDMLSFLSDWLIEHICKSDKSWAKFLEDKGHGSTRVA